MKTLQVGDYVKNLTEKQWKKLNDVENYRPLAIELNDKNDKKYYHFGIMYKAECLLFAEKIDCRTELTFEEFLSRAKNTFQP